jgi:serine/threonine protein kinase/Flp pilus assembly protein TadD
MNAEQDVNSSREQRLDEVIAAYVQAVEAGQKPDREELLARHLDLAAELSDFFADQDRFSSLAAPLRAMASVARPGEAPKPKSTAESAPGSRVGYFGDYELVEEIGRGGMGVVYKARQRSLRRAVALKMIRAVNTASPGDVRRFQAEAEIIANLDHPNIVPIYEVGEHQGQHYFTMKLIEGGSLTQRLDDIGLPLVDRETGRNANGEVRHAAQTAERQAAIARLMIAVAQAVHYAHERGLLHRDLKPANILLDTQGRPHVTDFGLAKHRQEDPGLTQSGAIVGTPSYMAPEQAAGRRRDLTTAADVYSLGAILYELLTGWPPFRAETPLETLRLVTERDPVRPRTLNPLVNRDLETICLKCLNKEPGQRYSSAEALADDLQCFLEDRPIRARRPTALERLRKWSRRHRPAAIAAAVVLFCMVCFLALAVLRIDQMRSRAEEALRQAEQAAWEAQLQSARADRERERAEANFRRARDAVDQMYTELAEKTLAEIPLARQELLENAVRFYSEFARTNRDNPELRHQVGLAYRRLGDLEHQIGHQERATAAYRQALNLFERLAADSPQSAVYRAELARTDHQLGTLFRTTGRTAEADRAYAKAQTLMEKVASEEPAVPEHRLELAYLHADRGELFVETGRYAEAEQTYRQAISLEEKIIAEAPQTPEYRSGLATTLIGLGRLLQSRGRPYADVEVLLRKALAIQQDLVTEFPSKPDYRRDLAVIYHDLAKPLLTAGRPAEVERSYQQALSILRKLAADFPNRPDYQAQLGVTYRDLGRFLQGIGRTQEAERALAQARAIQEKLPAAGKGQQLPR